MFQDLSLSDCEVAAYVNYSIANRFHNTIIGAVGTGFLLNFTNQIDIYSPTIEVFDTAIDARYGDTTHVYNAYIGNDGNGTGITIGKDMTESAIISPRLDHMTTPIQDNGSANVCTRY